MVGILADPFLEAATACIEGGTSPITCLGTSRTALTPTAAHQAFAKQFCSECALGVPGCEDAFFGAPDSKTAIAGAFILPLGDGMVDELASECASGLGCAATFMTCAEEVLAKRALPQETLRCVVHSLTTQEADAECSSGSGGASGSGGGSSSSTSATSSSASSGTGAGGPGGCSSNADCGSGVCEAGSCVTAETVCFDQDLLISLTLTKGDNEFNGNGPDVQLTVTVSRTSQTLTAKACVTMTETQADWTTANGCVEASLDVKNSGLLGDTSFQAHYVDGDADADDVFVDSITRWTRATSWSRPCARATPGEATSAATIPAPARSASSTSAASR